MPRDNGMVTMPRFRRPRSLSCAAMPVDRLPLANADRESLVARVAGRLRAGALVALPTETVYGLTVLPSRADAVERARSAKGRGEAHAFTAHVHSASDLQRLAAAVPKAITRLCD
ncbi:MAG: Sua5/YciO/YrdC/YwlC family protein, partial [Planctomycetes bacterium]|nr:Sua5/YciO/YrdC/YwlC family protein [Planctomycetota bacterium]